MVSRFKARVAAVLVGPAASLVFLIPPAAAQQGVIVVQSAPPAYMNVERVPYADLNLLTRAGTDSLHRRVSRAVERVCLYDNNRWYGLGEPDFNRCTWGAWDRARPQMMTAIYQARQFAYYRRY
jgi:UrcA family protein